MACVCYHCHGKGKWTYPIYEKCSENDEGSINLMGKFIHVVGEKEVDCPNCDGTGIISRKEIPTIFIGMEIK